MTFTGRSKALSAAEIAVILAGLGMVATATALTVAGGDVAARRVVVVNNPAGTVTLAQPASTEDLAQAVAINVSGGTLAAAASGLFAFAGLITGFSGLTPGKLQYLATDGALTETPPASGYSVIIGRAVSATVLHFAPQQPWNLG